MVTTPYALSLVWRQRVTQGFVTDQRFSSFSIPPCKLLLKSAVFTGIKKPASACAETGPSLVLAEFIKRPQAVKSAL